VIILLDTNIVVDIITKREGYDESLLILKYCELNIVKGYVSATTVTDVMYILRKHIPPGEVREAVKILLLIADVADVLKSDIYYALSSGIKDFEDAVQSSLARRIKADHIVTRNIKDFINSEIPAISPSELIKIIPPRHGII